jgi:tetratricopeptide (TPR) repeat protein
LEHARACVASTEALSRRDPADRTLLLRLADAHLAAAEAGDLSHGPQAVATYQRLADDEANGQRARVQMARALRGIGLDALNRNELAAAREAGQRAIALLAPIFKATPEQVRTDYALSLSLLGRSFAAQGDTAQAIPLFAEALTTIRDAYDADPNNAILQDRLPIIYELLARATERQDRAAGARLFREAIELLPSLTLEVATRGRDRVRGLLYTGYARTNFRVPPCAVLDQADVHFDAMRQAGIPIDPITAAAAQWVSNARARCES